MRRSGPPKRNPAKTRAWQDRSRRRLPPMSAKRRAALPTRAQVRAEVIARDRSCRATAVPLLPCGLIYGRAPLEVHELTRGAGRGSAWLDPELCIAVCPVHHDWITTHPAEAIALGLARSNAT